jgi:hypothetical protein
MITAPVPVPHQDTPKPRQTTPIRAALRQRVRHGPARRYEVLACYQTGATAAEFAQANKSQASLHQSVAAVSVLGDGALPGQLYGRGDHGVLWPWHEDQVLMRSPWQIVLSDEETTVLTARARSVRQAYRDRLRARIVLNAAADMANAAIADTIITVRSLIRQAWTLYRWDNRPARRP